MVVNERREISKPYLFPYGCNSESSLEINAVSQLSSFGEQSPKLLRDEFLVPEKAEMGRQFCPLKSQLFSERLIAYEVAVWFPGDPKQALTD